MTSASPSNENVTWLISFGDLLTLMVCFFLVIFTHETTKVEVNQALNPAPPSSFQDGKGIALGESRLLMDLEFMFEHINTVSVDIRQRLTAAIDASRHPVCELTQCGARYTLELTRELESFLGSTPCTTLVRMEEQCASLSTLEAPYTELPDIYLKVIDEGR